MSVSEELQATPSELSSRLCHLVSLDRPENGGPYGGLAARECMSEMGNAADLIDSQAARIAELEGQLAARDAVYAGTISDALETCNAHNARADSLSALLAEARDVLTGRKAPDEAAAYALIAKINEVLK